MIRAALALLLLVAPALAGTDTIVGPDRWELHYKADNKLVPGPWPNDRQACIAAAGASLGKYTCVMRFDVETVQNCEGVAAPALALQLVENEGGKYWDIPTGAPAPPEPSESNGWAVMVYAYVRNPAWPGGFPNCWVRGWAPESEWRFNPNFPGTPILEKVVPGQADISEPPNSIEPVCKPDGPNDCPVSPA
jgi:hypothetical protein